MTFWSALLLGLVASAHCAGMCGGLQMALSSDANPQPLRSRTQAANHLILLNLGRITTYCLAGLAFGLLGLGITNQIPIQEVAMWLRLIAGVVVLLIGLQLLMSHRRPFQWLERCGERLWRAVSPLINHRSVRLSRSYTSGLIWGFLPCGLVYSVLLTALFANDPATSALIMLGFGLGTLPSMVLTGSAYHTFKRYSQSAGVKIAGGVFFIVGGVLILTSPYWVSTTFMQNYPELIGLVFCIE